ncbi:AAA family ATPase [Actinosynnema sp. NPDC047251]|uniref:Novel STAND NTPase 1 domain-containing protein n=1 Tax=Saccharothrix espanaensis (strain ATCC 51144 / DSM 44229 / JCM 9112 / NBRC 15066 / NRRL 15764) TaxID=1179773 RepID=K0JVZ0_SACES|nr:AAA family ATPase [Saccharothrix espanaensis]CCH30166.1 hypothetical protein BN6_28570 [Saccharothrix espanaensis DSM 44229]
MTTDRGDDVRRMRRGLGARVVRVARRTGDGLRRLTPAGVVALLCAGAFGPVLAVPGLLGVGVLAGAGIGVLGSVGANVLTDVLLRTIRRAQERGNAEPEQIEDDLSLVIEELLLAGDAQAAELKSEIAALLKELDGPRAALEAALDSGDPEVQAQLVEALGRLGTEFGEFGYVLADVRTAALAIQESLLRQDMEHRADRERAQNQSLQLRLLRDELAVVERRTRRQAPDGGQPVSWPDGAPFRGLSPFDQEHEGIFYGRERLTAALVGTASHRLAGPGLVVVTGASGAGKSSLLRAGFIPSVARGSLATGSESWPRVVMTPTPKPLEEFATRLAALTGGPPSAIRDALTKDPGQAHLVARQAVLAAQALSVDLLPARLIVVVDQFEEVFTLAAAVERERFLDVIRNLVATPAGKDGSMAALVVLGVRGDFWDRCTAAPQLSEFLSDAQFTVGPMSEPDLRRAITGPATAAGLVLDSLLPETVLADLRSLTGPAVFDVGSLPLLSQAMLLTWNQREDNRLTLRGYGLSGGVEHAVSTGAEAAFATLTGPQQGTAAIVFRRLTTISADGQILSRRTEKAGLYALVPQQRAPDLTAVLDAFAEQRLLILSADNVEIAHETLLRAWPRLHEWTAGDQTDRLILDRLIGAAARWRAAGRDESLLPRGGELSVLSEAVGRWDDEPAGYPDVVVAPESRAFLTAASRAAVRAARVRRLLAAVVLVLLASTSVVAVIARRNATEADRQHDLALSRQLVAQSELLLTTDPLLAQRLARTAWHISPDAATRFAMLQALSTRARAVLTGHSDYVLGVVFSPDNRVMATASKDQTVRLWDVATRTPLGAPLTGHTGPVVGVAFSPDGSTLAGVGDDKTLRLWDVATRDPVGPPLQHDSGLNQVAFSPDGRLLATAADNGQVRLWDAVTRTPIGGPLGLETHVPVFGLAFSPDSRILATGNNDGELRTWDTGTRDEIGDPIQAHSQQFLTDVAFSPDGNTVITAGNDASAKLWDVETRSLVGDPLLGHSGPVYGARFSFDGRTLATTGADGTVRLWDARDHRPIGHPLVGHVGGVARVAFSPDNRSLASVGWDNTVRLWNPTAHRQSGPPLVDQGGNRLAVASSPDDHTVAISTGKTLRLWDSANRHWVGDPFVHSGPDIADVAFGEEGRLLVTRADDGTVRLSDVQGQNRSPVGLKGVTLAVSPKGYTAAVATEDGVVHVLDTRTNQVVPYGPSTSDTSGAAGVAVSSDGRTMAVSDRAGIHLWDLGTRQRLGDDIPSFSVYDMAFSPDGKFLATGGDGQVVQFWDAGTGAPAGEPLTGLGNSLRSVSFSPDGTTVATTTFASLISPDQPSELQLWDVGTRRRIGPPLQGHRNTVDDTSFAADGALLVSASSDGTIRLWDPAQYADPAKTICDLVGTPSEDQWKRFSPDEPLPQPCP